MGLIRALVSSTGSALGDQFKEFVTCPNVDNNVIIQRGVVQHGSGNTNASNGVISNGTTIAVPQGMAMMIIDNGAIVEFSAEAGTYTWDSSSEPSIFTGGLGKGIVNTFKTIGKRFTYGGQPAKDQRVYFVNIKTLPANTFGSQQPETIYDPVYESVEITYNGEFNIKVDDPIVLVNEMIGANPKDTLTFDDIFTSDGRNILKGRFAQKISEAISGLMLEKNESFRQIQVHKSEITDKMNEILDAEWKSKYGIIVTDVTLRINASEESLKIIREMDQSVASTRRMGQVYSDNMTGTMAAASGEAMKTAAGNPNGAMAGFMGMGFAQNAGVNMMGAVNNINQNNTNNNAQVNNTQVNNTSSSVCKNCGMPVDGKFCGNCGANQEEPVSVNCPSCGAKAKDGAKFCTQCGTKLN